ncbi:hypothetical protein BHAOGJBA_4734 [Methylobacterium hispanicum]|uniref:Uncharacterized protein n=1 Tax=Methylobacterium hispanicum TaxID=270350 RepID=A0AAV4ZSV3_9HYPH|nr:hypothetical protein [Methylobacterium hispanicum]GJD91186.1 hypothetical protein BHAOGJBA_4734 [Methylobacterium hispanicum]
MTHARFPDFSQPLPPAAPRLIEHVPFHADPVLAAIDAHDEAWAVWQMAPEAKVLQAHAEKEQALARLLATPCSTRFGTLALLRHLRWHIQHDGLADAAVHACAARAARELNVDFPPVEPPREPIAPVLGILRRAGEIVAGCALIVVGGAAVGLATLL